MALKRNKLFLNCSILLGTLFIILLSCSTPYQIQDFESITSLHKNVAILLFDVINTGVKPKGFTQTDIMELEAAEGKAFRISFYNEILGRTRNGKRNLRVNV